ncbi:sacsin-like [Mytilus californianus]|uniref:sacsin-like n=1 Tax=Mytilus californianus TaxID=6549 RepID=UPI0022487251|nr:sacsin-like [Mytilus californianus]XP_052102785.1 sacsin-like [Mytilus californianus]
MDGRHNKRTKTKKLSVNVSQKPRLHDNDSCVDELKTGRNNDTSLESEEQEIPTMAHTDKEDHSKGSDQEDSDGETTYEMNRPTLLRQLQTILGEYPDDDGILREMVQNAEDAGANCMNIMYDSRTRDPGGNSKIKQYFRTPGICVYNDAMFSDDDWKGIISIYNSVKEKETLKVGRFGLGFKSVFHMTDSPVIISGSKLLVIDPLRSEEKEEECREFKLKAIGRKHQPETTLACLMNKFGFNTDVLREGLYEGTIFWFPLRQKESKLSPTIYSEEKAHNLFKSFMKRSTYNLLFLKSLEKIEIYNEHNDCPYFKLEMAGTNEEEFSKARKMFKDDLNNLKNELPRKSIMSQYGAVIKTNTTEEHYAVVNMLTGADYLSEQMNHLVSDSSLHYSPYTGAAYCMKSSIGEKPPGHIFCFLPLPVTEKSMTGLPVHVNGFFDLEHNRRHIKEPAANSESRQTDQSLMWNAGMIGELLPETYYTLIEMMKTRCIKGNNSQDMVDQVYVAIPNPDAVESSWKLVLEELLEKVLHNNTFFTRQNGGKWIKFSEALFSVFDPVKNINQKTKTTVKKLLLDCEENLVELPDHVITMLKYTGHEPQSVTPQTVREKLKSSECWKTYPREEKLRLLSFVLEDCNYTDLNNLEILPLNNQEFVPFSTGTDVYVICDETAHLFPGLEDQIISEGSVTEYIWTCLSKMAKKELFQLRCITDECLPNVIQKVYDINFIRKQNGRFVQTSQSNLGIDWIQKVWKEISKREYDNLSLFESIPVIVVGPDDVEDINSSTIDESLVLEYVNLKGRYMLSKFDNHEPLLAALEKVVTLTKVEIFHPNQMIKFPHTDVIGKYIQLPIIDNILNCFKMAALSSRHQQIAREINEQCSDNEKTELVQFLTNHHSDIPREAYQFLQKLDLFCEHDNVSVAEMVSLEDNKFTLKDFMYPEGISYPRKYLEREHAELAKLLGATDVEEIECVDHTLDLMLENSIKYSVDDYTGLMIYLQGRPPKVLNHVLEKAKSLKFMPCGNGNLHSVNNLFDPTSSFLKNLFYGQEGLFPNENFIQENGLNQSFLQNLGLKTEDNISSEDLFQVATSIQMLANGMEEKKYIKAESLISYLKRHEYKTSSSNALHKIKGIQWVPIDHEKPDDYPDGLGWYGGKTFCSPDEVKSMQFKNLIGTVSPLVRVDLFSKQITACYKWCEQPEQNDVVEHYRNVIKSYEARQNSEYLHITKHIISYIYELWRAGNLNIETTRKLNEMKCIPTNCQGFKSANIVVQEIVNKHIIYILEPYIFELARDVADFGELFLELGIRREVNFEVLESLLQQISEKYMLDETTGGDGIELEKDQILTHNILKSIIAMEIDKSELTELLIPINSYREDCIVFEKVENCTYTSGKSPFSTAIFLENDNDDDEEEKIIYVHPSINELASKLGVASVTKRFIYTQNTGVLAWGQEEKLTTRISGLLDSYTDGLAVPKELVQNADDAGATKVCFLYDERENRDWRNGLFDQGMAECQGPALWVYNDAIFEEKDFKNIIELGGKTKILDTEKIGKFGLGFCSVYNVTDVPSFVSKNTLVVLDPHLHHLGEAAIGTNPGLRVPLTKSYRKNLSNQFKPYNGIFGCNLEPNNKDEYNKTLFRLPLRTQKQASESEIKDLQYTKREVVELLQKFLDSVANLLLFTQNVKEICVYHLNSKSQNPNEDKKLLFQAWKENTEKSAEENEFNILKKVTSAMKGEQPSEIKFPVQIIDIGIEVSSEAQEISKEFRSSRDITSWIISWGTGNKTFELANKLKQQGAIPVGSVAVPIRRDGSKLISFMDMNELPKGFYSKSRMFCFLPLPVEAQVPVHLNGYFMVEQDRKSITRYNQDDKTNDTSYWNDAMLDNVVQSAYINLLSSVACRSNDPIVETDYWKVWPRMTPMMNQDMVLLAQSFYRSIIMKDDIVFYRRNTGIGSGVKCSLSQAVVLDPEFRNLGENGQIAFDCLLEFYQDSCIIIDMPLDIYINFGEIPGVDINRLKSRIISKTDFYNKYFFPNLKEDYWQQLDRRKERDILVIGAIEDKEMHDLVKRYECIPVQMSNRLRKPCELVLEKGPVSAMFTVEDEVFPDVSLECYTSILINMGMMDDIISSKLLMERARTVGTLCKETALARSTAILKYLNTNMHLHSDAAENLKNIPFLPVLKILDGWPLPWKADDLEPEEYLFPPCQLFSSNDKFVIGSVGYVLDQSVGDVEQAVMESIGIRTVLIENVVEQINVLANSNLHSSVGLEETCEKLYKRLNDQLLFDSTNLMVVNSLKDFQHKRIVKVESDMVEPIRVALNLIGSCSPFLYEMPRNLKQYKLLWKYVGIPHCFDENTFIGMLKEHLKLKGEEQITPEETQGIMYILKNLSTYHPAPPTGMPEEKKKVIFIPDQNCILRSMCDVCYDDPDFDYEDEDVYIVHEEVTQHIIKGLGIMSKRHLYLSRHSDSIPFGQKEKLVIRLKGIIDAYPKDHSVLNELLQNADDAKATEIHFVFDQRQLGTKDIFDKKWGPVQGPALCVFNNACFTAKDLQGIQDLGEGSKSGDPSKTGQFGVGFNAVYHLTDVPSFLTRGQDTPDGGTFCVFDPHCSYLPVAQPENPGMRLKLETFQSKYGDVYKGYLQDKVKADTGTWFRLPLRTPEMARKSEISSKSFSKKDMNSLIEKIKSQTKASLLFLSNIKKISISYIKENCNELSDTFSVCLSVSDSDIENVKDFSAHVITESKMIMSKEKTLNQISIKEVRYTATLEDNKNNSDTWLIVQAFGFNEGDAVAESILTAASSGELGFLPRGGTAMKVVKKIEDNQRGLPYTYIPDSRDGNAFCFLPLPIRTGLPVHINGHFSVYANRNGLFGGNSATPIDDNRIKWNNLLLRQNVAFSYASCLEYSKEVLPNLLNTYKNIDILKIFFSSFPDHNVTGAYWKELVNAIYKDIHKRALKIFPIYPKYTNSVQKMSLCSLQGELEQDEIDWIPLETEGHTFRACFDNLTSFYQLNEQDYKSKNGQILLQRQEIVVRQILVDSGMKLICIPLWIFRSISKAFPVDCLSSSSSASDLKCAVADVLTFEYADKSSEIVVNFFRSWNTGNIDKCRISDVNIPLRESIFQSVERLSSFLQFCLKLGIECPEFEGLPLMLNNSEQLVCFSPCTTIMSEFCNLLPSSSAMFVHDRLVVPLCKFKQFFKCLDVGNFCSELLHSVDEQYCQQHGPLPWDSSQTYLPNDAWMLMFWEFLKTVPSISELSNWCLFPVLWYQEELVLVSFTLAYTVVNYYSFDQQLIDDRNIVSLLKKLSIPSLSLYNEFSNKACEIVASKQQPEKLARCLVFHTKAFTNTCVTQDECNRLVTFLATNVSGIGSIVRENLKQLKIFTSIFGEIVSVEGFSVLVVDIDNSNIVLDGLAEQANHSNILLLKHNAFHVDLYRVLQFRVCKILQDEHKLLEFYRIFVLPNFEILPRNLHLLHLTFIRDRLIRSDYLMEALRDLQFIPSTNGNILKKACEYFSPHHKVFSSLCKPSELPPHPFNSISWRCFMEFAGMKLELTKEQFLEFACHIQNQGPSELSESQSVELVKYLFSKQRLAKDMEFLRKIREIHFIKAYVVPLDCSTISPQLSVNKLIAFSGSLPNRHFRLAWTMQNILPAYASTSNPVLLESLLIQREPEINTVISHVHNVCYSLEQKRYTNEKTMFVKDLMTTIYDYIEALPMKTLEQMKPQLAETPFIHIVEHNTFMKVRNVILKEGKNYEIPPYLLVGSETYGKYFTLFRTLGGKNHAYLDHYFRVLASIKEEAGEKTLVARELECTESAVRGVLFVLQSLSDTPQVEESVFYLLSSEDKLFPSCELVYADRPWPVQHRLKNQNEIKFLKQMDQFKDVGLNVDHCLSLLPATMQLKRLSSVVREELLTDQNIVQWEVAEKLQYFLTSEIFVYAIKRLVKTKNKNQGNKDIDDSTLENISSSVTSVRIVTLQDVKTVLVYRNEQIASSAEERIFYHKRAENIVYVKRSDLEMGVWLKKKILRHVVKVIVRLCMDRVEAEKLQTVLLHYDNNFKEMEELLDDLQAVALDSKPVYTSWIPLPGSPVPLDCLDSLVQDLVKFSPGDYAVHEIFDNIDDVVDSKDIARIYIYVKIIEQLIDGQFPLYKVDVGEGQSKEVHSFLLYQIQRMKNQEMGLELHTHVHAGYNIGTKDKIKQQIEETLVDAWRLGQDKFKKVYKRLLLQWHPDKNDDSKFCCEITQHIIDFANRLNSRKMDISNIPQYRERKGNSYGGNWQAYNDTWNEHVSKARTAPNEPTREQCYTFDVNGYADRVRHRHSHSHSQRDYSNTNYHYSGHHPNNNDIYRPDPQPKMGRIWLKQAKNDIATARSLLNTATEQSFNWVCVISQQAAEKALKAIQVCEDAKQVSKYHSLITPVCLKNPTLKQAAEELESCIGDYSKMRYPRPVFFPSTPSDLYNHDDATETLKWAEIIVSTVDDMM